MTSFEPINPDFESRVRESFSRQTIMHTFGAGLLLVEAGKVEIELAFRDDLTQQHGFLHAGVIGTILDSACGYAAFSLMPADAAILSIEYKVNLLAPARGDRFVARGCVKRAGRTITVTHGDAVAIEGERETVVSTMLATMMTIRDHPGLRG